jgi:subtilisin family serine protease
MTPMRTGSHFRQSRSISHFASAAAGLLFALQATAGTGVSSAGRPTPSAQATPSVKPAQPAQPDLGVPAIAGQAIDEATGLPSYLVQLRARARNTTPAAADELIDRVLAETIGGARVKFRYQYAVVGFAASMTAAQAEQLRSHPLVARVEPDMESMPTDAGSGVPNNPNSPAPWGLRRITQPDGLAPTYQPCGADGTGVTIVIVDSGIIPEHQEFGGRVRHIGNFYVGSGAQGGRDLTGHGTHVAGCAAGATTGVAPGADIISLGVGSPSGPIANSSVVAALNWVAMPGNVRLPAVVNMSLGGQQVGSENAIMEDAVRYVNVAGIPVVVSAGNNAYPATWDYPASSAFALSVGATDVDDHPAVFSNYGPVVGIWAPGVGILAADWKRAPAGLKRESGTSMASPIVAGAAALYLQRHPPRPEEMAAPITVATRTYLALMAAAARGKLTDQSDPGKVAPGGHGTLAGSANRLLQACEAASGPITCGVDEPWNGRTQSVILGDGITPIDASLRCVRNVRSPSGPVTLTVNTVSVGYAIDANGTPVGTGIKARVEIYDAADFRPLWNSDSLVMQSPFEVMANRSFRSSTPAGLYVAWIPVGSSGPVGYGYAMTATVGGGATGDLDGNLVVDGMDLATLLAAWGPCAPLSEARPCVCDLSGDGKVDAEDLASLLAAWGPCTRTPEPGYVLDCNGNPVLRNYLGDNYRDGPGPGVRAMRIDPINAPNAVYPVVLDCAALGWDSDDGTDVVVSVDDPRLGACTLPDRSCVSAGMAQCKQAGGYFWGRGVGCDQVPGLASLDSINGCEKGDVGYGHPIASAQPASFSPTDTIVRQPVAPGVRSISAIEMAALPSNSAKSNAARVNGWAPPEQTQSARLIPAIGLAVRVTVYFRDGGKPLVVDRMAMSQPFGPAGDQLGLYKERIVTVFDVLPASDREVLAVSVQPAPEGADCMSAMRLLVWFGRNLAASDTGIGAEYSPDCGVTWLPAMTTDGKRFEASICITR